MICTRIAIASLLVLSMAPSGPAQAAPTLRLKATQETRRPDNFTGIPVWEPMWWIKLEAQSSGVALERVDYRANFEDVETRPTSGSWNVSGSDRDGFVGRVRVRCRQLADYDQPLRVRFRVVDRDGETSDWVSVELPPEYEPTPPSPLVPPAAAAVQHKVLGTVSYIANDDISMADVRAELSRQARAQGGTGIEDLQLVNLPDGRSQFRATIVQAPIGAPPPTAVLGPTVPAKTVERVLAEIEMGARR